MELLIWVEVWVGSAGSDSHLYDTKNCRKRAGLAGPMSVERLIIQL